MQEKPSLKKQERYTREEKGRRLIRQAKDLYYYRNPEKAVSFFYQGFTLIGLWTLVHAFVKRHRSWTYEHQLELLQLLDVKYQLNLNFWELSAILEFAKEKQQQADRENFYRSFKKELLRRHPKTVKDLLHGYMLFYGHNYMDAIEYLERLLSEYGTTFDRFQLYRLLQEQEQILKVEALEYALLHPTHSFAKLDVLSGRDFEQFLSDFFRYCGYTVSLTKSSYDGGCDLVLERFQERTAVQAKRQKNPVGKKAVAEVYASKNLYHCQRALVISSSSFTTLAKKLALVNEVELWDRKHLLREIKQHHFK